jgi:hypothetical protein
VQIEVGYGGDNHTIYLGELRNATSEIVEGPNIITTLSSGDKEQAFAAQRVKFTPQLTPQAAPQILLGQAATALGVGPGNFSQAISGATAGTGGPARRVLRVSREDLGEHARSNGMQWSVQDGNSPGAADRAASGATTAVLLERAVGADRVAVDRQQGSREVRGAHSAGLTPGLPLIIQSGESAGRVSHRGRRVQRRDVGPAVDCDDSREEVGVGLTHRGWHSAHVV